MAFGVGSGRAPPVPSLTADNGPSVQDVLARFLFFAGLLTAAGAAFFRFAVGPVPVRLLLGAFLVVFIGVSGVVHDVSISTRFGSVMAAAAVVAGVGAMLAAIAPVYPRLEPLAFAAGLALLAGADARRPCARSRQAGVRAVRRLPARGCGVVLARRARRARPRALFPRRSCAARAAFLERRVRLRPRPRCDGRPPRVRRAALGQSALVDRIRPASDREDGSARTARGDRLGEPLPARAPVVVRWSAPQCRGRAHVVRGAHCRGRIAHRSTAGARPGRRRSRDGGEGTTAPSGASHDRAGPRERRPRHRACRRLAGRGARCPGPGRQCGQRSPGRPRRRRGSVLRRRVLRSVSDAGSPRQGLRERTRDARSACRRNHDPRPRSSLVQPPPFAGCEASNTSSASPRARATGSSRTSRSSGRTD